MKQKTGLLLALLTVAGCGTSDRMAYIADAPRDKPTPLTTGFGSLIGPGDRLYIAVESRTPESVTRFNQETSRIGTSKEMLGYEVNKGGYITMPVLGSVEVDGLTLDELQHKLEHTLKLEGYVRDATVTVNLMNFHVTVIGEVTYPQVVPCQGSRLTLFEALAACGDLTPDGLMNRVVVVREQEEEVICDTLDLTRKTVFDSPYYYLQQGDIVYVEPNDKKKRTAYREQDWLRYTTLGVGVVQIAYQTIYQIQLLSKQNPR